MVKDLRHSPGPEEPPTKQQASETTGNRLVMLRRASRLRQEDLAQRSGVSARTIRAIETGQVLSPQRATVDLLATALGIDSATRAWLLTGIDAEAVAPSPDPLAHRFGRDDDLAPDAPAVQLFLHLAGNSNPDFLVAPDLGGIMVLCGTVGGLPLAIELAPPAHGRRPEGIPSGRRHVSRNTPLSLRCSRCRCACRASHRCPAIRGG
jgi:transcriptional regulator with XRE-family HTH domain